MLVTTLVILLVLIAASVPVAAALGVLSLALDEFYSFMPLHRAIGEVTWINSTNVLLVAIPMFVLLGEIILRAGIAQRMYNAVAQWLSWLPGGLMHANIGSCAIFAATSGSSVATAATIGTVALPEVKRRGYNERLFLGTLAAGGTLGILIPPSINLIIYGLLTDTSVPELYLAGFIPGAVLAGLFMLTTIIACLYRPEWGGERMISSWSVRFRSLIDLIAPLLIFIVVVGSIYGGVATPTEAASLGVVFALGLAAWNRALSFKMLAEAFEGAMRTTAMIMIIILAAVFLNFVLAAIGLTRELTDFILGLGLSKMETLILIVVFYLILGMFMETLSMLLTTVPLVVPIAVALGFDPVWFGILITVLLETVSDHAPIGVNLYVVHGVRGEGTMTDVIIGALPYVGAMFVMVVLLIVFPDLALWLPSLFY